MATDSGQQDDGSASVKPGDIWHTTPGGDWVVVQVRRCQRLGKVQLISVALVPMRQWEAGEYDLD